MATATHIKARELDRRLAAAIRRKSITAFVCKSLLRRLRFYRRQQGSPIYCERELRIWLAEYGQWIEHNCAVLKAVADERLAA